MKKHSFILSLSCLLISTNLFGESLVFGYWLTSGSVVKTENCDGYICATIETIFVEDGVDTNHSHIYTSDAADDLL